MPINAQNSIENSSDVVRATPQGRGLSALLILLAIGLVVLFQFVGFPYLKSMLGTSSAPPSPNAIRIIKAVFFGIAVLGITTAVVLLAYARKILRLQQCPPPDAWLWRDTRVVRGSKAIRYAKMYMTAAIVTCIASIAFAIYIALMLDRLERPAPQHKPQSGITILQQKSFTLP
jgi:Na+-driven multidrug efflux pump